MNELRIKYYFGSRCSFFLNRKFTILLLLSLFFSCRFFTSDKLTESEKKDIELQLKTNYFNVMGNWKILQQIHNDELQSIKSLIDLIAVTENFNDSCYRVALNDYIDFRKIDFSLKFFSHSDSIDYYDNRLTILMKSVFDAAEKSPMIGSFPLYYELIKDIKRVDDSILTQRINYDQSVKKHHLFVDKNKNKLKLLGNNPAEIKRFPLFEIPQQ